MPRLPRLVQDWKDLERFYSYFTPGDAEECWPWEGQTKESGYGRFVTWVPSRRYHYAHRISYELAHGKIPATKIIDHQCHNLDMD